MNTKLFLQVLLLLGCVALVIAMVEAAVGQTWYLGPRGWWEGAIACWVLALAVRAVYPSGAK